MSFTYKKIEQILGPLLFLKNKHKVKYGEIVILRTGENKIRTGQVVKISESIIVVELFEDNTGLSPENTEINFTGDSLKLRVSEDMIGQSFNSLGKPLDLYTRKVSETNVLSDIELPVTGTPINPFAREYPSDVIQTGISVIDGLFTLIRGQKLPIFSGQGLPHNKLAAQIVCQAKVLTEEPFLIIFCGIGIIQDDVLYFIKRFQQSGNIQNIISFINFADDPIMERLLIPRIALTAAEYFAFEKEMQVLVVLTDMTNYAEALREVSAAKEEIPCRKGFPGYLYSDFASLYERTGKIKNNKGSITQIPILTMPNDDISHPIPDTSGYITEGQLVFNRNLYKKGIYPPMEILSSISRLMKDAIGKENTKEYHADVTSQALASYSSALEIKELVSIVGEEGLNLDQKALLEFANAFEKRFINQDLDENRDFEKTFKILWDVISILPKNQLFRIHQKFIDQNYNEAL